MSFGVVTPRMRQLSSRKSVVVSVLDVGFSKVVCLIARLTPLEAHETIGGRTHRCKVLGIGHQRSRGVKAGAIVDLDGAENAIRYAIDAAERMAGVEVGGVIVNLTGGRLSSRLYEARTPIGGRAVLAGDVHRVLEAASAAGGSSDRAALHAIPIGFKLDSTQGVQDPIGMVGKDLRVQLNVATCDAATARNLMLAIERCHLKVEAVVATPYASGLSTIDSDEADLGVVLVDFGGGTTSVSVFAGGRLQHVDAVAVGGHHVTLDVAHGLGIGRTEAERIKTLHGACIVAPSDEREMISIRPEGEDMDRPVQASKSALVGFIRPRVEEILELVRDRLKTSGHLGHALRRLVVTGGASQLVGLPDLARTIISPQTRLGRPFGVEGLPESAKSPAFAAAVGLMVHPQVAGLEHFVPRGGRSWVDPSESGYVAKVGRWLKESF